MTPIWIFGPCALESELLYFRTGELLASIMEGRDWYYKASFDKANRTSIEGKRGVGLEKGLEIFSKFKEKFPTIKLITDVHECYQVEKLQPVIDCIQIPAFLCKQTDLLKECALHFNKINIKKGQWISPNTIVKSIDKIKSINQNTEIWLSERGTQFGYNKLVVDFSSVDFLKQHFDRVILDCTHSTQNVESDGFMHGDSLLAKKYMLASSIFGYNGVFAEVHPEPEIAISDGTCQLKIDTIPKLLEEYDEFSKVFNKYEK